MVLKIKFEKVYTLTVLVSVHNLNLKSLVSDEFMLFCLHLSYHIQPSLSAEFHASVNPHC